MDVSKEQNRCTGGHQRYTEFFILNTLFAPQSWGNLAPQNSTKNLAPPLFANQQLSRVRHI